MDDLISRKAAIEEFEDMVTSISVYGESAEARYATNARIRFIEKLNSIPTVPAVPLEPLCEWLDGKGGIPCEDCKAVYGKEIDRPCCPRLPFECNSREHWKWFLTKWMEGLDDHE